MRRQEHHSRVGIKHFLISDRMRLSRLFCSNAAKNAIKHHFLQKIKFSGPITVAEYMKTCLYQPQYGFYSKNPLGRHGHFITSPEISSLFGEMLGIWAARLVWCSFKSIIGNSLLCKMKS